MPKDNLSGKKLDHVSLSGSDMSETDLSKSSLRRSHLKGANLQHANLSESDLHGAHLENADVTGADLHNADLSEADLHGVDLGRAASIEGIKLAGAQGLADDVTRAVSDQPERAPDDRVLNVRWGREPRATAPSPSTQAQREQDRQLETGEENPT